MPGRMVTLERPAKRLVALTMPDGLYWFPEDVSQHALFTVLPGAFMAERRKTTGKDIAARSNVGQCVGTPAARPGTVAKVPHKALYGRRGACRIEGNAALYTLPLAVTYKFKFFARGAAEQGLFRIGQPALEVDQTLEINFAYAVLICQLDEARQFVQILLHGGEPERDGRFAGVLLSLAGYEGADIAPDLIKGVHPAHVGIGLTRRTVHREAIFIQPGVDQFLASPRRERDAIGVKEHVGPARFEIANHARQLFIEQRFAQPMQHHALQHWKLVHDVAEVVEAQVAVIFSREQRARALLA